MPRPASSLYLALQEFGCSLAQFEQIMAALVETGGNKVRRGGSISDWPGIRALMLSSGNHAAGQGVDQPLAVLLG